MSSWLSPSELDLEHWRWVRWKPQRGGWAQRLWVVLQEQWRRGVEQRNHEHQEERP